MVKYTHDSTIYLKNNPPVETLSEEELKARRISDQKKKEKCIENFNKEWGTLNEDNKANKELKENVELFCNTIHINDHKDMMALKKEAAPYTKHICTWEYERVKERHDAGLDTPGGLQNCTTLQGIAIRELQLLENGYLND